MEGILPISGAIVARGDARYDASTFGRPQRPPARAGSARAQIGRIDALSEPLLSREARNGRKGGAMMRYFASKWQSANCEKDDSSDNKPKRPVRATVFLVIFKLLELLWKTYTTFFYE